MMELRDRVAALAAARVPQQLLGAYEGLRGYDMLQPDGRRWPSAARRRWPA